MPRDDARAFSGQQIGDVTFLLDRPLVAPPVGLRRLAQYRLDLTR
jgi:hypothetical protein